MVGNTIYLMRLNIIGALFNICSFSKGAIINNKLCEYIDCFIENYWIESNNPFCLKTEGKRRL